ncbi:Phospholipase A2 family protein [Klebsormidium nitens]|uniref:Phospholipase A2 family protein n=1 Tax=Klebsormidium nitens TaxID=105231 RepID=A0A1Y1HRR5_KLENI|nr:Phospholipase A2 family protein [Klebsormidium nitens]|eukprot:GAQ78528.1 Phospholipase A2 family protein [Klebsormidium nitens]
MRFPSSLSLASFPPRNSDADGTDPPEDMRGPRHSNQSTRSGAPERAAKLAAEVVSEAETMTGCHLESFVPHEYTAQLDWHKGPRAALSRLFPRYGRYCGPNYSSGRDDGSKTWDQAPVDWLDNCCYRHDMAYDSHDQSVLLEADVQLLRCLRSRPRKADGKKVELVYPWGEAYEMACQQGLQHFLIPYRTVLIRLKERKQREEEKTRPAQHRRKDDRRPTLDL